MPATPQAAPPASDVGVVVMHGKGGQPGWFVSDLATALEKEGFQVANLDMPWSGRRGYDVDMRAATDEVNHAPDLLRAKGAHTSRAFRSVRKGTPVLYVSPKRDYLFLRALRDRDFGALPAHPHTRVLEPDADHLRAPGAAAPGAIRWIREVLGH